MKKIIFLTLLMCSRVFACREAAQSNWNKDESDIAKMSNWISIVEVTAKGEKENKDVFNYRIVKDIKGKNPNKSNGKIGPYSVPSASSDGKELIWKDKGCQKFVFLEVGRKYILFAIDDNPRSIQFYTPENEKRITSMVSGIAKQ